MGCNIAKIIRSVFVRKEEAVDGSKRTLSFAHLLGLLMRKMMINLKTMKMKWERMQLAIFRGINSKLNNLSQINRLPSQRVAFLEGLIVKLKVWWIEIQQWTEIKKASQKNQESIQVNSAIANWWWKWWERHLQWWIRRNCKDISCREGIAEILRISLIRKRNWSTHGRCWRRNYY